MLARIFLQVTKSSNVGDPEIIHQDKLWKYENNDLFVSVVSIFNPVKPALCLKEIGDDELVVSSNSGMYYKAAYYLAALQQMRIAQNTSTEI